MNNKQTILLIILSIFYLGSGSIYAFEHEALYDIPRGRFLPPQKQKNISRSPYIIRTARGPEKVWMTPREIKRTRLVEKATDDLDVALRKAYSKPNQSSLQAQWQKDVALSKYGNTIAGRRKPRETVLNRLRRAFYFY